MEKLGRLKRFFSPQLAKMIVEGGAEDPLKSHRREVTVVFLDLRGFTAFAETAEPEEVMGVLREYHGEMGRVILAHEGTLERFAGDGMMVFFNDPVPVPDPAARAVRMALTMHEKLTPLAVTWHKRGFDLQFSAGIAQGYATIGAIGFEGRWDYGAIGTVTNLAARLCGEAKPGQTLISQRVLASVEDLVEVEPVGELQLKGFLKPVLAYNVIRASASAATQNVATTSTPGPGARRDIAAATRRSLDVRERLRIAAAHRRRVHSVPKRFLRPRRQVLRDVHSAGPFAGMSSRAALLSAGASLTCARELFLAEKDIPQIGRRNGDRRMANDVKAFCAARDRKAREHQRSQERRTARRSRNRARAD